MSDDGTGTALVPSARWPWQRASKYTFSMLACLCVLVCFWYFVFERGRTSPRDAFDWFGTSFAVVVFSALATAAIAFPFWARVAQLRERRKGAILRVNTQTNMFECCRLGLSIPRDQVVGFEFVRGQVQRKHSDGPAPMWQAVVVYRDNADAIWRRLLFTYDVMFSPMDQSSSLLGWPSRFIELSGPNLQETALLRRAPCESDAFTVPVVRGKGIVRTQTPDFLATHVASPTRCTSCGYDLSGLPGQYVCPECGLNHLDTLPLESSARSKSG